MVVRKFLWIFVFINLVTNYVSYVSSEDGISLAFAIDDTRSMWDDIDQVKREAKAILQMVISTKSSEVKDFVLVTINDPDVILRTKTTSHSNFLTHLNRIRVHNYGNNDCDERAITGIEKALKFSRPESYIYVFTDASTKELNKLNNITRLCQQKQSQVVFVLTGDCGQPSSRKFTVYYDIAKACSGQVFRVRKDQVHSVLKTIEILLKGKNSIFEWKTLPKTPTYVPVAFTLDDKAEYAIVSTSAKNVKTRITTTSNYWGPEPVSEKTMWNENGKVVKLNNPKPGTYYAWVKGDSTISVVVYGRTDFTFGHGFSVLEPKSMKDTTKQPIAGLKQHLSINVTDPDHSVNIKSAQILDIKNNDIVIDELPLRSIGENVYITTGFLLPNDTFKIAVKGEIKKTHGSITRISKNIDPQIVDLIPESIPNIKIDEGSRTEVNYGSAVSLICHVTAHPAPKIEWYSSKGVLLPSNSSVLEDPVFLSYLKLSNITRAETYVCKASNKKGTGIDSKILVSVRPVFTNTSGSDEAVSNPKYGEDIKLPCNINSYLPITIKWFRLGKQLNNNSGEYSISWNGSALTLKSMNVAKQGKYTCEATLNKDPTVKKARVFEVKIPGLARPEIQSSSASTNISVMKGDRIELHCKIIRGFPKPYLKWFKKTASSFIQLTDASSEVLTVNKTLFIHAGQYKCEATNPMGIDTVTFDVTVNSLPVITIAGTIREIPYDNNAEYTCKVESYPPPRIVWKDDKGSVLQNKVTKISENVFSNHLMLQNMRRSAVYTCLASNSVGSTTDYVKIKVLPPFELKTHINDVTRINYGSEGILLCDIKSAKPMTIRWYRENIGVKSSRSLVSSSRNYVISSNGTKLTIKSMDIDDAGKYTCEASLLSVPTEKIAFSTTVNVVGLIRPEVTYSTTVLNGKNWTAICRIKAVPKPIISWQFKQKGSEEFMPIPGSQEELNIPELRLKHTGIYKCIANNVLGSTHRDINLIVEEQPVITNEKPNYYGVEGDLVMTIPCNFTGFPEPTVVWKKEGKALNIGSKYVIKGTTLYINKPVLSDSSEEYSCEAKNKLGTAIKKFVVNVVDPIPESKPEIKIDEGSRTEVNYGSAVSLICHVTAHPAPKIEWYSSEGVLLPSNSSVLEDLVFLSYLKLSNITRDATYVCKASNKKGTGIDSKILVSVRPVFTNTSVSEEAVSNPKYGEDIKIPCNINSYLPITIKWFRLGKQLNNNSGEYSISWNGSVLTLKSMNVAKQGKYTCEATLNKDPTVKKAREFEVKIPGLARPEIQSTSASANISVMKGDRIDLHCKIIRGFPKPYLKWFKKTASSFTQLTDASREVLTVNKTLFIHAGQYKCEATNPMGIDMATFDVTVNSLPVITIAGTIREIPYDNNAEYTCKVESYPPPRIVWKDDKGSVLQNKVTKISENVFSNHLILQNMRRSAVYTCLASNSVGSTTDYVKIKVLPPFELKTHINDVTGINYGSEGILFCDIKSTKPMTIRWYRENIGVKSSRSLVSSSRNYVISSNGTKLTIKSMDIDDAGKYTCEASLLSVPTEKIAFSTTVNVVGLIRPEVTYSTTVLNGKNWTAICRIKAVPKPIISWQFKQKGSEEFMPIPGSQEELNIPELRLKHTGIYKCIANNVLGSTHRDINLIVEEQPVITNEKPNYYGVEGDLVMTIPCNFTGFPEPTVVWKKEGKALNIGTKYVIKGTTLYINKPVLSDSSEEYTCEAKNKLGIATKKFVVEVVDNFEGDENFIGVTQDVHAEQEKPKSIKCHLKNVGESSVRWYMEGILTNQTGSTYTIEKVSMADEGNYTCRVNTDEESKSETYVLYIGYPPFFEDNSVSPVAVDWQEDNQVLDCAAESHPSPQYVWIHNEKVDIGKNTPQIPITDWGKYTCEVSNVHGNISKTFEVSSSGCYITMNLLTQNQPLASDTDAPTWPTSIGNSDILLKQNEKIKFSCPNNTKSTNAFNMMPSKQEIIAKCNAQDKFSVDGKTYRYSELQCNSKVEPSVLGTRQQCSGPNSELIQVGFQVTGFLDAYMVCYNRKLNVPLFASALTSASRIGDGVDSTKFKWSSAKELLNQTTGLETENWNTAGSCKCCYTKGQLLNVNELVFGPAQAATFKNNLNSIPIWSPSCNDSSRVSWQEFDDEIRAMSLYNKWFTWTGASEWGSTKDGLVPRFLWKVMNYDEDVTVMVYVNDQSPVDSDVRCSSPCESMMEADQFLYCCTLDEFGKKFGVPLDMFKLPELL